MMNTNISQIVTTINYDCSECDHFNNCQFSTESNQLYESCENMIDDNFFKLFSLLQTITDQMYVLNFNPNIIKQFDDMNTDVHKIYNQIY